MKLYQLFEIDPELGRTLGRAARGIGAAGQTISEPPPMRDIQGRIEQGIDELEKQIQNNPQQPFAQTFRNFLEKEKDKVKDKDMVIDKDIDINIDKTKIKTKKM